jgi:hypothetical protein
MLKVHAATSHPLARNAALTGRPGAPCTSRRSVGWPTQARAPRASASASIASAPRSPPPPQGLCGAPPSWPIMAKHQSPACLPHMQGVCPATFAAEEGRVTHHVHVYPVRLGPHGVVRVSLLSGEVVVPLLLANLRPHQRQQRQRRHRHHQHHPGHAAPPAAPRPPHRVCQHFLRPLVPPVQALGACVSVLVRRPRGCVHTHDTRWAWAGQSMPNWFRTTCVPEKATPHQAGGCAGGVAAGLHVVTCAHYIPGVAGRPA